MTTQFMVKPNQTANLTSKGEAYRTIMKDDADPLDVADALEYLGVLAARRAVTFIGQYYGLDWMDRNPEWKRDEWMRAVLVIEETIGRSLTGYNRQVVRRGMKPILDDAI